MTPENETLETLFETALEYEEMAKADLAAGLTHSAQHFFRESQWFLNEAAAWERNGARIQG